MCITLHGSCRYTFSAQRCIYFCQKLPLYIYLHKCVYLCNIPCVHFCGFRYYVQSYTIFIVYYAQLFCTMYTEKKLYLCTKMQMTFALFLWYNNNVRLYIIPRTMPFFVSLRPPRRENWDALKVAHGLSHCGVPYPLPKDSAVRMVSGTGNRMHANATASKLPTYYGTRTATNG